MLLHFTVEMFSAWLGMGIFFLAWPLYRGYNEPSLFWFSMWGLLLGLLALLHAVMSYGAPFFSPAYDWPSMMCLPESLISSSLIYLCVYPCSKSKGVMLCALAIVYVSVVCVGAFCLTGAMLYKLNGLIQVIPGAFVFGRLFCTLLPWGKVLKWAALATLLGGVAATFSMAQYDAAFTVAHMFTKPGAGLVMCFAIVPLRRKLKRAPHG